MTIQDVDEVTGEVVEEQVSDVEKKEEVEKKPVQRKQRRQPTKETILADLENLSKMLNDEINARRESPDKNVNGVKYLRAVNKKVTTLKSDCNRVMKQKQRTKRQNNNNSGFLKPVAISDAMAGFTGWNPDDLRSRVDVTKYICSYIKQHNLQNPDDRREIRPDAKLAKLLNYDAKTAKDPLKYWSMQTYLKHHFKK